MATISGSLMFRNGIVRTWVQIRAQQVRRFLPASCTGNTDDTLGRNAIADPFTNCFPAHTKSTGSIRIGIEAIENFHGSYYYNQ